MRDSIYERVLSFCRKSVVNFDLNRLACNCIFYAISYDKDFIVGNNNMSVFFTIKTKIVFKNLYTNRYK